MNCRRAQSDIALWAGDDLDEAGLMGLKRHLAACPECRCYMQEMRLLMRLVEECPLRDEGDDASKCVVEGSLWPSLSTRLVTWPASRGDRFNGWIPAVTVAAVCLAMVLIASPPQMLAPHDGSMVTSAEEDSWSESQSSNSQIAKWNRPPIQGQPAFDANPAIDMLLEPGLVPPDFLEADDPHGFVTDHPLRRGTGYYIIRMK